MRPIVLIGSSGHARVIADIVRAQQRYALVGLIDSYKPAGPSSFGLPVLGNEALLAEMVRARRVWGAIVAIGDNATRANVWADVKGHAPDLAHCTAIHPAAVVARDVTIGPGSVVMAGAVINPGVRVGAGVIINTRASIDHDSEVRDFASVAPGATLSGNVTVGVRTALGVGASVQHSVHIGDDVVVGGASYVNRDLPDGVVAYGVPAKVVRVRAPGDRYL